MGGHRRDPRLPAAPRPSQTAPVTASTPPDGPAYSVVLVAHVVAAVVGFGSVGATGLTALRARHGPGAPGAESVRRFLRPGPNLSGRVLYAVPLLGAALVAMSRGAFGFGDGFVLAGFGLWAVAVWVAETVVWPGERQLKHEVAGAWGAGDQAGFDRRCLQVAWASAGLLAVFVAAVVLMTAKP